MCIRDRSIGKVKITRIVEVERTGPMFVVPDAIPENIIKMPWLQPYFADEKGNTIVSVHALVIETPEKCIIVDTCLGNDKERHIPAWNKLQTKFLEDLEIAGYKTTDIDLRNYKRLKMLMKKTRMKINKSNNSI